MKKILTLLGICLAAEASAQIPVSISIDTERDTFRISPYIYGTNGQLDAELNITARRQGGNRMSGYNWETNASHAGTDYLNQNDNYLPWIMGLSSDSALIPGIVTTEFHRQSQRAGAYSLVTLQAIGYVSADKSGPVDQSASAPSFRFNEVKFSKGAPFAMEPDLTDNVVYMDEYVNFLKQKLGPASAGGIRGYSIDNEPGIWYSTHPRIHPQKVTVDEIAGRSIALSKAVRAVDPAAEIFGGVMYGFSEFFNLQDASDWSRYSGRYDWYIGRFLDTMRIASEEHGTRLMDVLDLHWYPEARGKNLSGQDIRIIESDTSRGVAEARMQAPRSLWDSSYKEDSWIGQWFSPIALIPHVQASIDRYYPGTKMAFTEFQYGPDNHISTGIAIADVLGIHGRYGVYMSNHWGDLRQYSAAAYKLYRNYDGKNSSFGNIGVPARSSDAANASVYASYMEHDKGRLHIILINKNFDQALNANFSLSSSRNFTEGGIWAFSRGNPDIRRTGEISAIVNNSFTANLPPLTAAHIVLEGKDGTVVVEDGNHAGFSLAPNPAGPEMKFSLNVEKGDFVSLALIDATGNTLREWSEAPAGGSILFDGKDSSGRAIPSGVYIALLRTKSGFQQQKFSWLP